MDRHRGGVHLVGRSSLPTRLNEPEKANTPNLLAGVSQCPSGGGDPFGPGSMDGGFPEPLDITLEAKVYSYTVRKLVRFHICPVQGQKFTNPDGVGDPRRSQKWSERLQPPARRTLQLNERRRR